MVKIAAKIVFSIVSLTALGFCVAYVMEDIWRRVTGPEAVAVAEEEAEVLAAAESRESWQAELERTALQEEAFADRLMAEGEVEGGLMLSFALGDRSDGQLEEYFVELMARDLDDYRAVEYAGRVLQEIAQRQPELAVALLSAMTPAERERLVPSVARGWTLRDPAAAFSWIDTAWVQEDGAYIDRNLQNELYASAMDALVGEGKEYALAAKILAGLADPELKAELTEQVAHRIVRDGPENALDRLAGLDTGVFDTSVMDAVAEQWAARDGVGAADWVLSNEEEMSSSGVRSIAKHLTLGAEEEALVGFHQGLVTVERRDTVASEVARLKARREPLASAEWVHSIESPPVRRRAVFDALYEIGYEDFGKSVNYIDYVYEPADVERGAVVYSTLRDWLDVDVEAVAGYLGSGRANLSESLSEELLVELERVPHG